VHLLQEVLARMAGAILFLRDVFSEFESKPDLYGSISISTTCVFPVAMISNTLDWIAHRSSNDTNSWLLLLFRSGVTVVHLLQEVLDAWQAQFSSGGTSSQK
jgi:hypothetical protein